MATMTCAIMQCSMQFDYYDLRGKTLMSQGRVAEATQNMEAAAAFRAPSKKASAELLTNLAICYVKGLQEQAPMQSEETLEAAVQRIESTFRQAYTDDPTQFLAHYSHGNFLASQGRIAEAQTQFRTALAIKPDFSDAYINLGTTFEFEGRVEEAVECYEVAAKIEPHAQDVQQLLAQAKAKLGGGN
jgi:tetratricopeptide (TPR) repeat protein